MHIHLNVCKQKTDVRLLLLHSKTWNHLTVETIAILVCQKFSPNSFKNGITYKLFTYKSYMYIQLNVCKQMIVTLLLLHRNTWNYLTVWKKMINGE